MTTGVLLAAAQLVFSGTIGQTRAPGEEPVPWTDCAWAVSDSNRVVHLPGGWRVCGRHLARETCDVPGTVFSDGAGALFYFHPARAELGRVTSDAQGLHAAGALARLHHWDLKLFAAPASCRTGFAAKARFFALDRRQKAVFGWTETGARVGSVFAYADRNDPFVSLAIHPASGDLLLGTGWPENRIRRFRADGTEVTDHVWPAKGHALTLANADGKTWVLGTDAALLAETRALGAQCRIGACANNVRAIAAGADGWWLATSQGAQLYRRAYPERCAWRVGGVAHVGALALHDGRVLAGSGWRLLNFWLDDRPGDNLSSDDGWVVAKRWNERIDRIEVKDDVFYIRDGKSGDVTGFDPRVTAWVFRAKRQFPVKAFAFTAHPERVRLGKDGACAAVAADGRLRLFARAADGSERCVQELPVAATCLAAEGDWLVAYVPARKAIVRYRLAADAP